MKGKDYHKLIKSQVKNRGASDINNIKNTLWNHITQQRTFTSQPHSFVKGNALKTSTGSGKEFTLNSRSTFRRDLSNL
jgi:hypothetical protein